MPKRYLKGSWKHRVGAALATIVLGAGLAACGGDDGDTGESSSNGGGQQQDASIAYFNIGQANAYTKAVNEGIQDVADEEGVEVTQYDGEFNADAQRSQIQDATTSGNFDGFIVHPLNGAVLVPVVTQAIQQGIETVGLSVPLGPDLKTNEPQIEGLVMQEGYTYENVGKDIASLAIDACGDMDSCEVAFLIGAAQAPYEVEQLDAFEAAIAEEDAIELVATQEGEFLVEPSQRAAQDILQANPDLDVIVSTGDQMTFGAEQAARAAGRADEIEFIGAYGSDIGVKAVREGRWFGTTVALPYDQGRIAAEQLIAAVRDEELPYDSAVSAVELESPVGSVITQDNVDQVEAQWTG